MPSLNNKKINSNLRRSGKFDLNKSGNKSNASIPSRVRKSDLESRIINVSQKRQITLPLKYFQELGLGDQVDCTLEDGAIVIRPISKDSGEFAVEILKDLMAQGYSGDELVQKFAKQNQQIKKAIGRMMKEADGIASGEAKSARLTDVFGDPEDV